MHITWWLATAKVGSVQWREAGGDSSPRHDFYLGSNPQLARRGPRVLRESTNQENASDAFRHRRPTVCQWTWSGSTSLFLTRVRPGACRCCRRPSVEDRDLPPPPLHPLRKDRMLAWQNVSASHFRTALQLAGCQLSLTLPNKEKERKGGEGRGNSVQVKSEDLSAGEVTVFPI